MYETKGVIPPMVDFTGFGRVRFRDMIDTIQMACQPLPRRGGKLPFNSIMSSPRSSSTAAYEAKAAWLRMRVKS